MILYSTVRKILALTSTASVDLKPIWATLPAAPSSLHSYSHRNSHKTGATPQSLGKAIGLPSLRDWPLRARTGDALKWRLWVGKTPAGTPAALSSAICTVVRSKSEEELFVSTAQHDNMNMPGFIPSRSKGAGLRRSSTVPSSGFSQQMTVPPPCPSPTPPCRLTHHPGTSKCQASSMSPHRPVNPCPLALMKRQRLASDFPSVPYAYAAQPPPMVDVNPTSGSSVGDLLQP
jgi:hypothetical protein